MNDLLAEGVDVNGANHGGQTALTLAALMGHSEVVSLLLSAGADVRLQDNHGLTALDWAQRRGFWEITELLTIVSPFQRVVTETKTTSNQTASEPETVLEKHAAEEAIEPALDAHMANEELERRKAVGFGPAAIAILKATAKAALLESDLKRQEPAVEQVLAEESALRTLTEPPERREADQMSPTSIQPEALAATVQAERLKPAAENVLDAQHVPHHRTDGSAQREAEQMPTPPVQPETLAATVEPERREHVVEKTLAEEPAPHYRTEGSAQREADRRPTTPVQPERLAASVEPERLEPMVEKTLAEEPAPRRWTEEPARSKAERMPLPPVQPERLATGTEAERLVPPPEAVRVAESALRNWPEEPELRGADQSSTTAITSETLAARLEAERIFEQARRRVEEEVRRRSQHETRSSGEREMPRELAATREAASVKRCPKCNIIYENDIRTICPYDSAQLVGLVEPASYAAAQTIGRPTLWALVAITLLGSVGVTYLVTNYLGKEKTAGAPAAASTGAPAKAEENLPVVGGALVGKEINLPNAEYPIKAKSAGTAGTVVVVVAVNKKGGVVSARALNGDMQLRAAAVKAARKAKFSPEKLASEEQITSGTITYIFKP